MADFDLPFLLMFSISLIAVIIAYLDQRRRLKEQQKVLKVLMGLLDTQKEQLKLLKKQSKGVSATEQELERQKILADREKQQWKEIGDLGKAIAWLVEHTENDYE